MSHRSSTFFLHVRSGFTPSFFFFLLKKKARGQITAGPTGSGQGQAVLARDPYAHVYMYIECSS
jgi:hypothetical protein